MSILLRGPRAIRELGRRLTIAALLAAVLVACIGDSKGADLAAAIQALQQPGIERAQFRAGSALDPPEVYVWLKPEIDEQGAVEIWCTVVEPTQRRVAPEVRVSVWLASGTFVDAYDRCSMGWITDR